MLLKTAHGSAAIPHQYIPQGSPSASLNLSGILNTFHDPFHDHGPSCVHMSFPFPLH